MKTIMIVAVLSMMMVIVGCERNAEVPEIVGRTIISGNSNDRAIFFKGIDGVTGYELKLYMSESHAIPYSVIQWESHWQTAIPDVYFIPINNAERLGIKHFTLEPTSDTANSGERRDLQRMSIDELPTLELRDANGSTVRLLRANSVVSITEISSYRDKDGNLIERVVDGEGNVISERVWNEDGIVREIEVIE